MISYHYELKIGRTTITTGGPTPFIAKFRAIKSALRMGLPFPSKKQRQFLNKLSKMLEKLHNFFEDND